MKNRLDKIFIYFIGYLYMLVMLFLASTVFNGQVPFSTLLLIATAVYPVINLLLIFRISRIVSILVLGGSAIAAFVLYLTGTGGFIAVQVANIIEIFERIFYYQEIIITEQLVTSAMILIILTAVLLSVMIYLLFNRFFRMFLLTGAIIAMHIGIWALTGNENKTLLAFTCLLTAISYFRHVYEKKVKQGLITGKPVSGSLMLFTIPAVIIPVMIVMSIPKSDYPIQWPWLDRKVNQALRYLEQRFGHTDVEFFTLSVTGFSGSSNRLGGPVRPNHTVMMDVRGDKRTYLRGAAYSWYGNNMWHQNSHDQENVMEVENTLLENRIGWAHIPVDQLYPQVEGNDKELLNNLVTGKTNPFLFPTFSLEIRHRNLSTKTVFTPLLTILPVTSSDGGNLMVEQNTHGIINNESKLSMGSRYTVYYSQPMYGAPMLKRALCFSYGNLYQDALNELMRQRNEMMDKDLSSQSPLLKEIDRNIETLEILLDRSREITKEYTVLSENTPERVINLAKTIISDCNNNYEKVIAIEEYLKNNYEYTLNPSRVPEGKDFVDWFLFEDKRGYCTYYATSMAVMLRSVGIPARYVEGFVMPEKHHDSVYTITSRHAHAWVEVYFQGFGWLTFEPTPIYADVMQYLPSADNVRRVGENTEDLEALMKRYADMYGKSTFDLPTEPIGEAPSIDFTPYVKYIPLVIAGLIFGMIIINLMAILIDNLLLMGINNKKKVMRQFQTMLIWLQHSGYTIKTGESVLEFGRRVDKSFVLAPYTFTEASEVYCRLRYGDKEVSEEDLLVIETTAKELKRSILKDFGIRRFIPLRRILYRI